MCERDAEEKRNKAAASSALVPTKPAGHVKPPPIRYVTPISTAASFPEALPPPRTVHLLLEGELLARRDLLEEVHLRHAVPFSAHSSENNGEKHSTLKSARLVAACV